MNSFVNFFTSAPEHVWQEVVFDSILLPPLLLIGKKLLDWFINTRPVAMVFKGFKKSDTEVLIYLSQLSVADEDYQKNNDPHFITQYPQPSPTDRTNRVTAGYHNIDPVWSESDGRCAAEVLNILGRIGRTKNFRIANTINDWDKTLNPKFSVGFNPKTRELINDCSPVNFNHPVGYEYLGIDGHDFSLPCQGTKDAGIIQKTYFRKTDVPIFILAGLGVMGTEVSGHILNRYCVQLGKLFGKNSFCLLFSTDLTKGKDYYEIVALYPAPTSYRKIRYFRTFFNWKKKNVFPKN